MILEFERQFASVELCWELRALGGPSGTTYCYACYTDDAGRVVNEWERILNEGNWPDGDRTKLLYRDGWEVLVPAYSVAELGELLRRYPDQPLPMPLGDGLTGWQWCNDGPFVTGDAEIEADARASLLIHLMKTGARTGGWV